MSRLFVLFLMLFIVSSCSLNADQERSLSEATSGYLEARKKGAILAVVSMYHPKVVKAYREMGDSVFVAKFSYTPEDHYLSDPIIQQVEKKGDRVHVLYAVKVVESEWGASNKSLQPFVAISEDAGKSWFFIDRSDYVNKTFSKDLERLLFLKE